MVGRRALVALAIGLAAAAWASILAGAAAAAPPSCLLPAAAARGAGGSCGAFDGGTVADEGGEPVADEDAEPAAEAEDPAVDGSGPVVADDPQPSVSPWPETDPLPTLAPVGDAAAPGAMVDGGPAADAAAPEASASSAPTPPNGAEPAADGSPAPVVAGGGEIREPAGTTRAPTAELATPPGDTDLLDTALRTVPLPSVLGLSRDVNRSAPTIALLGFALLLLLVAHQFVERSDPRLDVVRDAEGIVRFR